MAMLELHKPGPLYMKALHGSANVFLKKKEKKSWNKDDY